MSKNSQHESPFWTLPLLSGTAFAIGAWLFRDKEQQTTPPYVDIKNHPSETVLYAFVKNPEGAYVYRSHDDSLHPQYGYGREPITRLAFGTYVGKLTGITYQDLAQVITSIDGQIFNYWVPINQVNTLDKVSGNVENLKEKLQSDLKAIAHSVVTKIFQ